MPGPFPASTDGTIACNTTKMLSKLPLPESFYRGYIPDGNTDGMAANIMVTMEPVGNLQDCSSVRSRARRRSCNPVPSRSFLCLVCVLFSPPRPPMLMANPLIGRLTRATRALVPCPPINSPTGSPSRTRAMRCTTLNSPRTRSSWRPIPHLSTNGPSVCEFVLVSHVVFMTVPLTDRYCNLNMTKNLTHMVVYYDTAFAYANVSQCAGLLDAPYIRGPPALTNGLACMFSCVILPPGPARVVCTGTELPPYPIANMTSDQLTILSGQYYKEFKECTDVQVGPRSEKE